VKPVTPAVAWLGMACAAVLACRSPAPPAPAAPPQPIDLEPRCLSLPFPDEEKGDTPALPASATERRLSPVLRAFVLPAPDGLATLRWVLPSSAFGSRDGARLAATVLAAGEATSDPDGLRAGLVETGIVAKPGLGDDALWLDLSFPAAALPDALATLGTLQRPLPIPAERFETLRREVALQALAETSMPQATADRLLRRVLGAGPSEPGLRDAGPESFGRALASGLRRADAVLLYRGPDDPQDVLALLEKATRDWPRADPDPTPVGFGSSAAEEGSAVRPAIHLVDRPGSRQVELLAAVPTVRRGDPDFASLEMLASLLGADTGGRLFRDLRERQGLAYEIGAEQTDDGTFRVSTRTRPERLVALVQGIEAHLEALSTRPLEDCEASMLGRRMRGRLALEVDEPTRQLDAFVRALRFPGSPTTLDERRASYVSKTARELDAVAARRLTPRPTWVVVGGADAVAPDLEVALPGRPLIVYDANLEPR
jgi:predicted Zn-dependent peptidase